MDLTIQSGGERTFQDILAFSVAFLEFIHCLSYWYRQGGWLSSRQTDVPSVGATGLKKHCVAYF